MFSIAQLEDGEIVYYYPIDHKDAKAVELLGKKSSKVIILGKENQKE